MDLKPETHRDLSPRLCGTLERLEPDRATVGWTAVPETAADATGLVHGGFIFGVADHAAMLAVNEPTVVLGSAEVRFSRPVRVGERLLARAVVTERAGRKRIAEVTVVSLGEGGEVPVFSGRFTCLVPDRHVLAGAATQ